MPKVTINLLPEEFRLEELKRAKFYKIQSLGVIAIMSLVFMATLTIALRILQSQSIQQIQAKLTTEESKVVELKSTQASLLLLKNRLTTINQYLGVSSKQVEMYELINKLIPPSVPISSLSIDKEGNILVVTTVSSAALIDELTTKILSSEDKIASMALESLSRGRDGVYRVTFKVKPKG